MLDGEGYAKKNGPQSQKPAGQGAQGSGPNPLSKDRSRELEDSWGSLQIQAEQMLAGGGEIVDESPVPSDADSVKKKSVMSGSTTAANVSHNVCEEEIIAEEIRLANEKQGSGAKRQFHQRRGSEADMVEDFDNEYLDDDAFDNAGKDDIVDEVEEEDALRMIDEEIMNTALAK